MWGEMRDGSDGQRVRKPHGHHPDRRLTAVRIRTLTTPGRYADGNGLYLVVDHSRAKRWLLRTVTTVLKIDQEFHLTDCVNLT